MAANQSHGGFACVMSACIVWLVFWLIKSIKSWSNQVSVAIRLLQGHLTIPEREYHKWWNVSNANRFLCKIRFFVVILKSILRGFSIYILFNRLKQLRFFDFFSVSFRSIALFCSNFSYSFWFLSTSFLFLYFSIFVSFLSVFQFFDFLKFVFFNFSSFFIDFCHLSFNFSSFLFYFL